MTQQGDAHLFHTPDGGELDVIGGIVTMCPGLDVAAYISLFGGNGWDDGTAKGDPKQYWGNRIESDPSEFLRSRTQYILQSLPFSTFFILRTGIIFMTLFTSFYIFVNL